MCGLESITGSCNLLSQKLLLFFLLPPGCLSSMLGKKVVLGVFFFSVSFDNFSWLVIYQRGRVVFWSPSLDVISYKKIKYILCREFKLLSNHHAPRFCGKILFSVRNVDCSYILLLLCHYS